MKENKKRDLDDLDLDDLDDIDELDDIDFSDSDSDDFDDADDTDVKSDTDDMDFDFDSFDDEENVSDTDDLESTDESDELEESEEVHEDEKKKSKEKVVKKESKKKHSSDEEEEDEEEDEGDTDEKEEKGNSIIAKIAIVVIVAVVVILLLLKGCNKKYTVKFDTNGGNQIAEQKISKDGKLEVPEDPVKEGYIFAGWYLDGEEFDFDTKITGDITLEAKWEEEEKAELEKLSLNQSEITIAPGSEYKLTPVFEPEEATAELEWYSNDESVVTVDQNGNIKAVGKGTTTVVVTTKDGKFRTVCAVTVSDGIVEVTGVTVSPTTVSLFIGNTKTVTATVKPSNASNKGVTWKSDNPKVATVDQNGKITAVGEGTTTITVTTADGSYTASVKVTVKKPVEATSIEITGSKTVQEGQKIKLSVKFTPTDTTDKSVTWSVNNTGLATIDKNGNLTAKKAGQVVVTAKSSNGKTATYNVTITEKAPVFTVELTANLLKNGGVTSYSVIVKRNGVVYKDYLAVEFNYSNYALQRNNDTFLTNERLESKITGGQVVLPDKTKVKINKISWAVSQEK